MKAAPRQRLLHSDARLMFVLLDALHCNGTLASLDENRWFAARERIERLGDYDAEADTLFDLLTQAADAGTMSGSWIESRWNSVQQRHRRNGSDWEPLARFPG